MPEPIYRASIFRKSLIALISYCIAAFIFGPVDEIHASSGKASSTKAVSTAELFAALDLTRPGLENVALAVRAGDLTAAGIAWADYFKTREKPTPHFDRKTWPRYIRSEFPQVSKAMITQAQRLVSGEISHGTIRLPVRGNVLDAQIDWFYNPHKDSNYVSIVGSQWFLNPLGRAYLLTNDEIYARVFASIFESWFDHRDAIVAARGGLPYNPVDRSYYPGVRARVLADNYYCLASSKALTPAIHTKLMRELLTCARFVDHDQKHYRQGNQQVTAILALSVVGLMFPEFEQADVWLQRAETLLAKHLQKDFFADGAHRELCTQYHKSCLRDIGYIALISEKNGRPSPLLQGKIGQALERAYDWLAQLVMPTGQTPPLHSAVFSTDYAVHLLISATYRKRADHAWLASRFWQQNRIPNQKIAVAPAVYLLAPPLSPTQMSSLSPCPPDYNNQLLEKSGLAIMRTGWQPTDRYLVLHYGWANTSHAYPAALSFLLAANGELVATHPGSPLSYEHPAYAYCHTTQAHNTVTIDNRSYPKVKNIAPGGYLDHYADLPGLWYFVGHHDGYKESVGVVHHRQIIAIQDGPIVWIDKIQGGQDHCAEWNFHTPLDVSVQPDGRIILQGTKQYALVPANNTARLTQERRWAALLPKQCQPGDCGGQVNVLRFEKNITETETRFVFALFEGKGNIRASHPHTLRLETPKKEYLIVFDANQQTIEAKGIRAKAQLAVVEIKEGQPTRAWIKNGTHLSVGNNKLFENEQPYTGQVAGNGASSTQRMRP